MTTVKKAMTGTLHAIDASAPLNEAAQRMKNEDVGLLGVLQGDKLVATLTDRDIAVQCVAEARDPKATPVIDVATSGLHVCAETEDLAAAADLMAKHQVRRLVVTDAEGRPQGVISVGDLAACGAGEPLTRAMAGICRDA